MANEECELPPSHFGDYPNGAYMSAFPPDGFEKVFSEEAAFRYEGRTLRIMWDEGAGPLWGDRGLLPDDPEWMRRALGLSEATVAELLAWMRDMTAFWLGGEAYDGWQEDARTLTGRGDQLAERLRREVGPRCKVRHHALKYEA